jgi:hypothetical protein
LIAEVEMSEEPEWGIRRGAKGINALGKLDDGKRARVVLNEPQIGQSDEPTIHDIREAIIAVYGTDFGRIGDFRFFFESLTTSCSAARSATAAIAWS